MDISKKIISVREEKRIKQFEVAEKLNIEPSNYSRLEKRGEKLTIEQLKQIADALGVTINELLVEHTQPKENEKIKELEKRVLELEEKTYLQKQLLERNNKESENLQKIYFYYILILFQRVGFIINTQKFFGKDKKADFGQIPLNDEELKEFVSNSLVKHLINHEDIVIFDFVVREWNGDKRLLEYYNQNKGEVMEGFLRTLGKQRDIFGEIPFILWDL